jgi:predicted NBD/HSP70 family sugar kinase
MRLINRRAVLQSVRDGAATVTAITQVTGLTRPTVGAALSALEQGGLVRNRGLRVGSAGRAPTLWGVDPDAAFVLGIDVGPRHVRLECRDLAGERRGAIVAPPRPDDSASLVSEIGEQARLLTSQAGFAWKRLGWAVIGAPGTAKPGRSSAGVASDATGFERREALVRLAAAFDGRLTLARNMLLAAIGESATRTATPADFALITVDRAVGAAIVRGGVPWQGWLGSAGEIAFLPRRVGEVGEAVARSQRGEFEELASVDRLLRDVAATGHDYGALKGFVAAVQRGEARAVLALREHVRKIAWAVAMIMAIESPPCIVFTGSLPLAVGAPFLGELRGQLRLLTPLTLPRLELSTAGVDAAVVGASSRALKIAWERILASLGAVEA